MRAKIRGTLKVILEEELFKSRKAFDEEIALGGCEHDIEQLYEWLSDVQELIEELSEVLYG